MYRGTGQGNWNHGQGGNIYPGANQYKQRAPDGSNNYGYMMGQGPDNPGFPGASMGPRMQPGDPRHAGTLPQSYAAPNRPQNPGDLGRNAWNQVNPTGMQHPGYYRSPNPGSMYGHYSNMDPKMAQENPNPAAMNQIRRNDYTAWRHPSPQQPPVSGTGKPDASYYPTSHGQFQQQFGQLPHQSEYMRSPMQKPGQDFHYTRGSVPSQQQYMTYQQAPPQFQQGVRRSVFSGYPQAEQSLSQSAPVRQTPRFRSASNDMSFGVQDRYPTPAGVNNPRMVTPVPKPGTRRPSNDVYNPQISPSGMSGQNASLQGDRHPSYGPYHQMPKSAPNMQQQIMSIHTQAGPKPPTENFNLDSLLEDCVGSTGSFMQQLEDVVPNSGDGSSKSSGVQVNQRSPASQKNFMMRSPLSQPNIRMPAQLNQPTTPIRRPGPYHQSLRGPMMPDQSLQRTPQMNPARPSGDPRSQVGNYQWHGDSNMLRSPRHSMSLGSPEPMRKPSPLHSPQHPLVMEPHQQIMKSPVRSSEMSNQNQFVANSQQSQIPISVPNSQNSHQKQISQHVGSYGPFQPFPQPSMPGQGPTTTNDQIQASTLPESTLNLNAPPLNLPQDVALTNQTASQAKSPQASLNANTSYTDFNVSAGSNQDHSENDLSISDKAPSDMATMDQMQEQHKQVNDVTLDEKTQLPSSESTNVTETATVENTSISSEKIEDSNNEDTTKDQTITNELTGDPSLPKQDVLPSVTQDDTANEIQPQPDSVVATSKPQPMLSPTSAQAPMTQGPSVDNNASKSIAQVLPAAPPVRPVPPSMPPSAIPHPTQYPPQSFPPGPTVPDTYPHGGENRHPTPGTSNVPQMMHPAPQPGVPMHGPRLQPGPVQVMHRPPGPRPPMPHHPGKGMYPQPNAMHMQGANRGMYPAAGHPGRPGYRPTEPHRFPPRPFGSPNQGYYSGMNYHMQHPGGMMPQQPQHPRQHFAGAPPGHMPGYPYSGDGAMRPGWMGPMHPMNHADGVRPGVPPRASSDFGIGDKSGRKSKLPKEAESPQKAKKQKKTGEKKGVLSDSSEFASDSAKALTKGTPSKGDRKRKKPPATFKTKKKKRKQGDEEDDFDKLLPSDAVINTNLEKRRSARNVKRKQYVETFETQLSDEISDSELELVANDMAEKQANLRLAAEETEDQMIVEKILDIRARRVPKVKVNENDEKTSNDEETEDQSEETKTAEEGESDKPDGDIKNTTTGEESDVKKPDDTEEFEEVEEYFLKYKNFSYLHCEWKIRDEIQDKRVDGKIKRYKTKMASLPDYLKSDMSEAFNPDFVEVERVLDVAHEEGDSEYPAERHYFIKWCSLPYEDSTWEREKDICPTKIREFEERCKYRPPINPPELPHKSSFRELGDQDAMFLNNNCLRDYQLEGVNWLLFNWYNRRNCILADEMGLGKTVQSITFLQKVFDTGLQGPFLIVAPLSTICNWQREFMSWTGMNVVVYHGSQASRDMIKAYEFLCRDENLDEMPGQYKMHAVVTTYEMIVNESSHLLEIQWKCAIIDEAHRLKNQTCKLADSLRSMHCDYKVLLTGTPLQNNVEELFSLLSFLQPEIFSSSEAFITEFGDMKNNSQVEKLQELLKPMMLRRLKEDVEKSLAPKEETIIEVELTSIQKKYYRAIMEKNFEFLSKGAISGNTPNLMNTMMELRKCCNHPYLIKGAEDKIHAEQGESESSLQTMIHSSGKLVLIDKLLPRLKTGGHRVLVFSQMVRCLDILEDYLVQRQYSYERIDGGIRGSDRQAAIDRFSKPDSERFVFLLCTRAGGLGINLTAADTVIIFDSDWNPQNDLQAQARCHRIGQTKPVKIYRLITRNSYEREMFDKASLKLGLDKAVLQSISGRQDDPNQNAAPALSKQEVENLLKLGAYGAIMDENDDANKFCEEDIDQILQRRTQTIKIAPGEKGSTFSKASFISNKEGSDISLNDPNFWEKWAKKADLDIDRLKNNKLIIEEPRRRKQTRRFGGMTGDVEVLAEIGSDSDSDYDGKTKSRRQKNKMKMKNWSKKDFFRVEKTLLTFGWGRWKCMLEKGGLPAHIKTKELETVCRAILMYCLKFYSVDDRIKIFLWTLITPTNCSSISSLPNLDDATSSPRGRKDESDSFYERISQEWIKEIDVNAVLPDDSFKRHLQTHSTKIILRVRMVQFLKTEILGSINGDIDEITPEQLDINFPDMIHELQPGWDFECDRSLLFGVYKHGFGKYSLIRADPKLVFLKKFGMPDDKALADDLEDLTYDDNNDPEYKPAKLNFSEYSEFEDSPVPNTPETGPNSPVSSSEPSQDGGKNKDENSKDKDEDSQDQNKDEKAENPNTKESERSSKTPPWPSTSELNSRVRRIVAVYQKQHKQIRSRLMGLNQSLPKSRLRESSKERSHWTRREESDFYRTVSTFGIEYTKQGFSWARFRKLAKLDKKSDRSLEMYYLAFKAMCEKACGHKTQIPEEIVNLNVTRITEERASRTLYRIELLNRIRLDVLQHKNLDENLKKCEQSIDLPAWWKPGEHDKELLIGMDRHGVTRTDVHILNDRSLSFLKCIEDQEKKMLEKNRKKIHASEGSSTKAEASSKDKSDNEQGKSSEPPPAFKEEDLILGSTLYDLQKWPKDRILIQRVEHICYCVVHGKWPISRMPEESIHIKTPINVHTLSHAVIGSLPKGTGSRSSNLLLGAEPQLLDEASSKLFSSILAAQKDFSELQHLFKNKNALQGDGTQSKKSQSKDSETADHARALGYADSPFDLGLASSKFNETLQTLLGSDLSRFTPPQKSMTKTLGLSPSSKDSSKLPPSSVKHEEKSTPALATASEKASWLSSAFESIAAKKEKNSNKKKTLKSKTGFISPAVLPPESRIPVYNPSEKIKLVGEDAPLNKDLADWLKKHRGFVVDYKALREKLNNEPTESSKGPTSSNASTSQQPKQSSKDSIKTSERSETPEKSAHEPEKNAEPVESQAAFERQIRQAIASQQANLLNQPLMNSAGILNALYGNMPDMSALTNRMLAGLPPFVMDAAAQDPMFHQSSSESRAKREQQSRDHEKNAESQLRHMASLLGFGNVQNPADLNALTALLGGAYPPPVNVSEKDIQKQLKQLFQQQAPSFDPKALQFPGFAGMPSVLPGMQGMMNPLLYGMYGMPELAAMPDYFQPMHMQSFLENEYANLKDGKNLNGIQDLLMAQQMASMGFDINSSDFQKFLRAQESLQTSTPVSLGKTTPSGQNMNDFDDNLQSVYQQLHASSLQQELKESRKKEKAKRYEKKSSGDDEAPVDLRSSK